MLRVLPLEPRPKDHIPKPRTHPKPRLLPTKMMLVVVFLQPVEIPTRMFRSVDMVEGPVTDVVSAVPREETSPVTGHDERVGESDHVAYGVVADDGGDRLQGGRVDQSVAVWEGKVRVVGKHVVDAVGQVVHVSYGSVVGEVTFRVEDEPVDEVLRQREGKEPNDEGAYDRQGGSGGVGLSGDLPQEEISA